MFTMLLANPEGRAYLTDSKLLKEIALNLEALDPVNPNPRRSNVSVLGMLIRSHFFRYKP
jgi:hypothetical protein